MKQRIEVKVNGKSYTLYVRPWMTLLDVLRNELKLKSVHRGCEEGECGACTVLLNGEPVYSCLVVAPKIDGAVIITAEGLTKNEELHPLMDTFLQHHAVQCGYCTPGLLMTAYYLISNFQDMSEEEIRQGIQGNLCRCTGYVNIVRAIRAAYRHKESGNWW